MADIFVGSVAVGVVPDARGWDSKMRAQLVPSSAAVGDEIGKTMSGRITDQMGKAGSDSAGAFSDTFQKRLKAALAALPKAKIDADSTEADRKVAELRAKLEELAHTDIIDPEAAMRSLAEIDAELAEVSRSAKDIRVTFDTKEARAQLALLKRDIPSGGGGRGGILGKIGGLFGGGGGSGGEGAGGAAASAASSDLGLINPATISAGIASLPFIAQTAAGGIVAALGGALAGVGIAGAVMSGKLTKQWKSFTGQAKLDLESIGQDFIPVLKDILSTAGTVLGQMTPVFSSAMGQIAGPFKTFSDTLLRTFTQPEVALSIHAVATAFGDILKALTPTLASDVNDIAHGIINISNAISENPQAFADFVSDFFKLAGFILDLLSTLTRVANWIEAHWDWARWILVPEIVMIQETIAHFNEWRHDIADIFDGIRHDIAHYWANIQHDTANVFDSIRHNIAHYWDLIFEDTIGKLIRLQDAVQNYISAILHDIANIFDTIRHDIAHAWDLIYSDTIGKLINLTSAVVSWFRNLPGRIAGAMGSLGSVLVNAGENLIDGLWTGIKNKWNDVVGWFKGLPSKILGALGIHSPPDWSISAGKDVMTGVLKGLAHGASDVKGFFVNLASSLTGPLKNVWKTISGVGGAIGGFISKLIGGGGSGVARWAGVVAQAAAMPGCPDTGTEGFFRVQTELAEAECCNNWDINAQNGDPSRGLLQTIGSTFAAYHVPGTSNNIYDPLANVAAAINYAVHTYGPTLERGGMGMGSGHGYDAGGWLPPGVTMAVNNTGSPEAVLSPSQWSALTAAGNAPQYHAHFDGLTGQVIEGHVRTAFQAMSITQGSCLASGAGGHNGNHSASD